MIVDGRKIAHAMYHATAAEVKTLPKPPVLAAITCSPNFETERYLELKKHKAADVGITLRVIELLETVTTREVIDCIEAVLPDVDGVVVQLPFPSHIDREAILAAVPVTKDPDGFSYGRVGGACLPPVVAAIDAIAAQEQVSFLGKHVVVLGQGRLVGLPAVKYLESKGALVTTLTEGDHLTPLKEADIIVTGIGKPQYVTKTMVKSGVYIFDAGTSEDGGVVVGDVHPEVAEVAALFTPVPGGIGPITVAALLQNLVSLIRQYK